MSHEEKRRHVVYGVADSYFQALPVLSRSAALGGSSRHPIMQGRDEYQYFTVEEARRRINEVA